MKKTLTPNQLPTLFFIVLLAFTSLTVSSQENVSLVGQLEYGAFLNDIWGYEDESGHEYALVGATNGFSVVDVTTDPSNPEEVFFETGPSSTWRDVKVFGNYAYVVHDNVSSGTPVGLLIADLSNLPASVSTSYWESFEFDGNSYTWGSAHNIFIDESGFAYIVGANLGNGGVIILDLNADPLDPPVVGIYDDAYVHDIYVRGDTMWTAEIYEGVFSVIDVSEKANPQVMASQETPSFFTHNLWLSDDGHYLYTTDEVDDGYIAAYDVSDLSDIDEIARYQSSPGMEVMPHNTFYYDGFLVTAYYADGVRITDVSNPPFMIETGHYDTSPNSGGGSLGCWGVYPYTASGYIYATDMQTGFFLLDPEYKRASYLSGLVTDVVSGAPLNGVTTEILGSSTSASSGIDGVYRTGVAGTATVDVLFSKVGYENLLVEDVELNEGELTELNVELVELESITLTGQVQDFASGAEIGNSKILIIGNGQEFEITADNGGNFSADVYEGAYELIAGKWGYVTRLENLSVSADNNDITISLERGYYDDFSLDFGWIEVGGSFGGAFVREEPNGSVFVPGSYVNPEFDVSTDIGDRCYITGNEADFDYLIGGNATIISPAFNALEYENPEISFYSWYVFADIDGITSNNDGRVYFKLNNGSSSIIIDSINPGHTNVSAWEARTYLISDFMPLGSNMKLLVEARTGAAFGDVIEVGFDQFQVSERINSAIDEEMILPTSLKVLPNPVSGNTALAMICNNLTSFGDGQMVDYNIFTMSGHRVVGGTETIMSQRININTSLLSNGWYILKLYANDGSRLEVKFAVMK